MAVQLILRDIVQRQLGDGTAGSTHDRGIGQGSRPQACGKPCVEMKNRIHHQDRPQRGGTQHHGEQHQLQAVAVQAAKELGTTLEANGIDEQHKKHRFQLMGHIQSDLTNDQPHQQRPGNRPKMEAAELDPANQHTQADGQEYRYFRVGAQCMEDKIDHCRSPFSLGSCAGALNQRSLGTRFSCSGSPR
ncbi:hypothetical protein D3C79_646520 [compost metagenome]